MGIFSIVVLAVIVAAVIWAVMIYNNLVNLKHAVAKAWANVDVLLKQRHDELPKLVETCKQYKQFEQETLKRVTDAPGSVQEPGKQQDNRPPGHAESRRRAGHRGDNEMRRGIRDQWREQSGVEHQHGAGDAGHAAGHHQE